jgi:hypothetical protein
MEDMKVDEGGHVHNHAPQAPQNRASRRAGLSRSGRKPFLNKDGTKIITRAMQAQGAFGKQKNGMTKLSADKHKWVEIVAEKPKKIRKKKTEE